MIWSVLDLYVHSSYTGRPAHGVAARVRAWPESESLGLDGTVLDISKRIESSVVIFKSEDSIFFALIFEEPESS